MTVAVIDGMGGGIGAEIINLIKKEIKEGLTIMALGTNASATERMMQAKPNRGATGENAIRISVRDADYIIGPIGIAFPNSMMGEITPAMAEAVSLSHARKILLPVMQSHYIIPGLEERPLNELMAIAVRYMKERLTVRTEK